MAPAEEAVDVPLMQKGGADCTPSVLQGIRIEWADYDSHALTERPDRSSYDEAVDALVTLDGACEPTSEGPTSLPLSKVETLPALFQPRGVSLVYSPHASNAHVAKLVKVLRSGNPLDPVSVASFGSRWFLIDGHHRLKAYRDFGKLDTIPVAVCHSDKRGRERVDWAIGLSVIANVKDKLAMSSQDKSDAAWRLTLLGRSKRETIALANVGEGTVANQRRAIRVLTAAMESGAYPKDRNLYAMSWRHADHEARRLLEGLDDDLSKTANFREVLMRKLTKSLTGVLTSQTDLFVFVDALEALRPGVSDELRSLLDEKTENDRARAILEI